MKVLIWTVCFLCNAIVQVIIKDQGIILGGIPMALLFGATWYVAQKLCKIWDNRKKHTDEDTDSNEPVVDNEREAYVKVATPEEQKKEHLCPDQKREKTKIFSGFKVNLQRTMSFLVLHRKLVKSLFIVSCVIMIICLIGYNAYANDMLDALYHYDIAFENNIQRGAVNGHANTVKVKRLPCLSILINMVVRIFLGIIVMFPTSERFLRGLALYLFFLREFC